MLPAPTLYQLPVVPFHLAQSSPLLLTPIALGSPHPLPLLKSLFLPHLDRLSPGLARYRNSFRLPILCHRPILIKSKRYLRSSPSSLHRRMLGVQSTRTR